MALLIDIEPLHAHACDIGLETFYKAGSEPPDDSIWKPHESPFIRRLIELFTERGLMRISSLQTELAKWLDGEMHRAGHRPPQVPGMMERWTEGELSLVRLYLETLPPDQFTLDDWMMVVDYLVQRYLPEDVMKTEAEWLAVRSSLMGRVQANMQKITAGQADRLLSAMPNTVDDAARQFALTARQRAVMEYGRAHCADNVVAMTDAVRHRLRRTILNHQQAVMLGDKAATAHSLQTKLQDEFATLNRDWRRIAVTEAGEMANQGMIASLPPGSKVQRLEQYQNACGFCRKIDGAVMTVVPPDKPDKDGDTEIWVGKTNVGRSASPRKRVGGALVERSPEEMWWIAAGTQHPHCRGRWIRVGERAEGDDPEFAEWLDNLLRVER